MNDESNELRAVSGMFMAIQSHVNEAEEKFVAKAEIMNKCVTIAIGRERFYRHPNRTPEKTWFQRKMQLQRRDEASRRCEK